MVNKLVKYQNTILMTIGILLIILSFFLIMYDKIELLKANVFDEVELLKYRENNNENNQFNDIDTSNDNLSIEVSVDNIDSDDSNSEDKKQETKKITKEIIGYLEIKKINLKQGLVSKNSYYNNVNRNIQILNASDYPDKEKGNVILAAHSGQSYLSFFKNLYQLELNDEANIYYKGKIYTYHITDIYNVPKVGSVEIRRDYNKSCLTLITCTKNSKTEQTVYILELVSVNEEGDNHA